MKAEFEKIINRPNHSFTVKMVEVAKRLDFTIAYHYHPEFELIWTQESHGKRYVGNNIADYKPGEVIFMGKNLPHSWMTTEHSVQMVVQMREEFLGQDFISAPECYPIRNLFAESYRGIQYFGKTRERVQRKMKKLYEEQSFGKLLILLEILYDLSQSDEFEYLSTEGCPTSVKRKEFERVHILYNYIHENYQNELMLDKAAKLLNMAKSSFCKFVKRKTKKTFSQLVNEVRLSKATELLVDTDHSITQICYESGFNDPAYFFRQFGKYFGTSPKQFREAYQSVTVDEYS